MERAFFISTDLSKTPQHQLKTEGDMRMTWEWAKGFVVTLFRPAHYTHIETVIGLADETGLMERAERVDFLGK